MAETERLYRQVEVASDERRRLLTQMLERSLHDRRRFAGQLREQAVSAHAAFSALAGTGRPAPGVATVVAEASAVVRGDLARRADWLQGLLLAIRPLEGRGRARREPAHADHRLPGRCLRRRPAAAA